jgi:hypothetical protein
MPQAVLISFTPAAVVATSRRRLLMRRNRSGFRSKQRIGKNASIRSRQIVDTAPAAVYHRWTDLTLTDSRRPDSHRDVAPPFDGFF